MLDLDMWTGAEMIVALQVRMRIETDRVRR